MQGLLPLALACVQGQLLVAVGADGQLVLRGVEGIQEQVALAGAVWKRQRQVQGLLTAPEERDLAFFSSPEIFHNLRKSEVRFITNIKCSWPKRGARPTPDKAERPNKRVCRGPCPGPCAHSPAVPCANWAAWGRHLELPCLAGVKTEHLARNRDSQREGTWLQCYSTRATSLSPPRQPMFTGLHRPRARHRP